MDYIEDELEMSKAAWKIFLSFHAGECDTDAVVDEIVAKTASIKDDEIKRIMDAWAEFRQDLRNLLSESGIHSNPCWSEAEIVNGFHELITSKDAECQQSLGIAEQQAYEAGLDTARVGCQARIERIFQEVERISPEIGKRHTSDCYGVAGSSLECFTCQYQALKKEGGIDGIRMET